MDQEQFDKLLSKISNIQNDLTLLRLNVNKVNNKINKLESKLEKYGKHNTR